MSSITATTRIFLTRIYRFCCSHRLHSPSLSTRKNLELYHECNNRFGHGHDYSLEVSLRGNINPLTGMSSDLARVDRIVKREIVDRYDHKHLNYDVRDFKEMVPTAENILRVIWERLSAQLPKGMLYKLKLVETSNNYFEYYG